MLSDDQTSWSTENSAPWQSTRSPRIRAPSSKNLHIIFPKQLISSDSRRNICHRTKKKSLAPDSPETMNSDLYQHIAASYAKKSFTRSRTFSFRSLRDAFCATRNAPVAEEWRVWEFVASFVHYPRQIGAIKENNVVFTSETQKDQSRAARKSPDTWRWFPSDLELFYVIPDSSLMTSNFSFFNRSISRSLAIAWLYGSENSALPVRSRTAVRDRHWETSGRSMFRDAAPPDPISPYSSCLRKTLSDNFPPRVFITSAKAERRRDRVCRRRSHCSSSGRFTLQLGHIIFSHLFLCVVILFIFFFYSARSVQSDEKSEPSARLAKCIHPVDSADGHALVSDSLVIRSYDQRRIHALRFVSFLPDFSLIVTTTLL